MSFENLKVTVSTSKIIPDIDKIIDNADLNYSVKTNTRIVTRFTYPKAKKDSAEEFDLHYARNQIPRNQYRIPMKMLVPDKSNNYVCQKAPLTDKSQDIRNAAKVIEPLNIGFDEYIRCIPINQNLEIGTTFLIKVSVPYESNKRYRFKSNQLICKGLKEIPFDQNIDIGALDIGSEYSGKFTVDYVDLNVYDSYTLYSFRIIEDDKGHEGFEIITYEYMNVDIKQILKEIIKIVEETDTTYRKEFESRKKNIISYLNVCIKAL